MKPTRIALAAWIVLVLVLASAACSDGGSPLNSDRGQVRIVLGAETSVAEVSPSLRHGDDDNDDGDAMPRLAEANVTFSSLLARNLDGELIDLAVDLPRTVDLISLIEGRTVSLPMGVLPPGTYDQLVVVMTQVEFVLLNGARITITPPGGGWTSIVPVRPFTVVEGETTTLYLKFKPRNAFREIGGVFRFHPDFDCERRD